MSKFYAVKCDEDKIFEDWESCKNYLSDRKNYKYKSFSSYEEAEAFLSGENIYENSLQDDLSCGYAVAYTDGSYEERLNEYAYGAIVFSPDGTQKSLSGKGNDPLYVSTRNIAGEVLGVLSALKYAVTQGFQKIKIYHDYAGLSFWAKGEWKASSPISVWYRSEYIKLARAVDVEFVKVKGHSNNAFNEKVDKLAKSALFENKIEEPINDGYFCFSGDDITHKELCNYIYKQAIKPQYFENENSMTFCLPNEKIVVYRHKSFIIVGGKREKLFCIALNFALEAAKNKYDILIEDSFGFIPETFSGTALSRAIIQNVKTSDCSPFIFFSLNDVYNKIRSLITSNGVKTYKISTLFTGSENGYKYINGGENAETINELYNFYYFYRTKYLSLNLGVDEAMKIVGQAEKLLGN